MQETTVHEGTSLKGNAEQPNFCIVIPTYNNDKTLRDVIVRCLTETKNIIVVNDGSTDGTKDIIDSFPDIHKIHFDKNSGKGKALSKGFEYAIQQNFDYALSIDSDGQHYPEDTVHFLEAVARSPESIIIGARNLKESGQPDKNSFANKLSNFWFKIETGMELADTQSGFRLYPLKKIRDLKINTRHYDYELEILVKSYWNRVQIESVPVRVYYPPDSERVTHFKPVKDFLRISLLNVKLVFLALFWYRPLFFINNFSIAKLRRSIHNAFNIPGESAVHKSNSVALGIFFGIIPIWGYQLVTAILFAYLLKLNKAIVILTAQISLPPMIPFIIYLSIKTGELITGNKADFSLFRLSDLDAIKELTIYVSGAFVLAIIASIISWILSYSVIVYLKSRKASA